MELKGFKSVTKLANFFGVSISTVSTWKKRGTIPFAKILAACERENWDYEFILTGKKKIKNDKGLIELAVEDPATPYRLGNEINELLKETRKILTSGNQFAINALSWNIRYFSYTIDLENRIKTLEQRFEIFEKDRVESNNL